MKEGERLRENREEDERQKGIKGPRKERREPLRASELLRSNNAAETKTGSPESPTAFVIYRKKRSILEEIRETPKSNPCA